jgi:hypothetical protein
MQHRIYHNFVKLQPFPILRHLTHLPLTVLTRAVAFSLLIPKPHLYDVLVPAGFNVLSSSSRQAGTDSLTLWSDFPKFRQNLVRFGIRPSEVLMGVDEVIVVAVEALARRPLGHDIPNKIPVPVTVLEDNLPNLVDFFAGKFAADGFQLCRKCGHSSDKLRKITFLFL